MPLPRLDVNDVLSSPYFMDTFTVVRRVSSVDDYGRTQVVETQINTTGVIYPGGANAQERPKEYATGRKSIEVLTQFRLRQQSQGYIADLVLWHGDDYLVTSIEDWTQYGRGYVRASATVQDLQDQPPPENP